MRYQINMTYAGDICVVFMPVNLNRFVNRLRLDTFVPVFRAGCFSIEVVEGIN